MNRNRQATEGVAAVMLTMIVTATMVFMFVDASDIESEWAQESGYFIEPVEGWEEKKEKAHTVGESDDLVIIDGCAFDIREENRCSNCR